MDRISAIAFLRCRTGVVAPRFEVIGDQDAKPKSFNCPTKTAPDSFPASSRSLLRNVSLQQSDDINHNCLASCTHMRAGAEVLPRWSLLCGGSSLNPCCGERRDDRAIGAYALRAVLGAD